MNLNLEEFAEGLKISDYLSKNRVAIGLSPNNLNDSKRYLAQSSPIKRNMYYETNPDNKTTAEDSAIEMEKPKKLLNNYQSMSRKWSYDRTNSNRPVDVVTRLKNEQISKNRPSTTAAGFQHHNTIYQIRNYI
jgi:hypothetical protein